jgi:hypothetical protein
MDFILENWAELLLAAMAFAKVIVNLTPSINDNRVFTYIDLLVDAIVSNNTKDSE